MELGDGNIARACNVAEWSYEFVSAPHINYGNGFVSVEPLLEFVCFNPCERPTQSADQSRQHHNGSKQAEAKKAIANCTRVAAQRLAPSMTEPRIGKCSRGHADKRRDYVVPKRNAREPQRIVRQIERKEGN